jgi:hypothetical protein
MLAIAISLFARSRLPWHRKVILCGIFSLGIFVILAAILNKYYSFTHPFGSQWTYWYVRESSTAIIVSNLPFIWTLLRRMFNLKSFDHVGTSEIAWHSSRSAMGRNPNAHPGRTTTARSQKPLTSSHRTQDMSEKDFGPAGFAPKLDTQSSKGSADVEWGVRMPPADVVAAAPETSVRRPPHAHWRDQSVYGRADLEVLRVDPWDRGSGGELGGARVALSARRFGPLAGYDESRPASSPSSSDYRRRIKGQEEMMKMQEGLKYKYNGIDDDVP